MKNKRHIIVNRKFQVGMAFSFASLSALIMAVVIIILSALLVSNNRKLDDIGANQQLLADTQTEIFKSLVGIVNAKNANNLRILTSPINEDNERNMELVRRNNLLMQEITKMNGRIITMLIISAAIQSLIIFYIMLRRSHRISGPLFLLNRYMDEMKQGRFPEIRPLRAHDDFQELFASFRELVNFLKERG